MKISTIRQFGLMAMVVFMTSCSKETENNTPAEPKLIFRFVFDSTQARLNNLGQPSTMPAGHAGVSPIFRKMSAHYLELSPGHLTPLGSGNILYHAPETTAGGAQAIDFSQALFAGPGEAWLSVPLSSVQPGTYPWLRISLAYQEYDIPFRALGNNLSGRIASFIGYRTYINQHRVMDSVITVQGNRNQGYWAFETSFAGQGFVESGQAPAGATTVPNPLFATSPVPAGSCVVTGQFATPLTITGMETTDQIIDISLSVNKSFEWTDANANGIWEPLDGETVVDMGIRGLIPIQR